MDYSGRWLFCAAKCDSNLNVIHDITNDIHEIPDYIGSKYVQSYLGNIFQKIKLYLDEDKLMCFVGTPCQVVGLKKYLKKDYDNLITVDFACHGVPSPKLLRQYIKYEEKKHNSKIKKILWRNKTYGYHSSTLKISYQNGYTDYSSARINFLGKAFFADIASRQSCYNCKFKTIKRCSDFTIYDCWSFSNLVPFAKDDDKGYTNLIVQTGKGEKILQQIMDSFYMYSVNYYKAIERDGIMVKHSSRKHHLRDKFYIDIETKDFQKHMQSFIPVKQTDYIIEKAKIILFRLGILPTIKKLCRKKLQKNKIHK